MQISTSIVEYIAMKLGYINLSDLHHMDTADHLAACREAGIPFIFAEYGFGDVPDAEMRIRSFSDLCGMFL